MSESDHNELHDKIHELVTYQLDGTDPAESQDSLQELVVNNAQVRRIYVQYIQELFHIASRLSSPLAPEAQEQRVDHDEHESGQEPASRTLGSGFLNLKSVLVWAIAAALMIVLPLGYRAVEHMWDHGSSGPFISDPLAMSDAPVSEARQVATLVLSNEAEWYESEGSIADLSRLNVGQELRLTDGSVELVFDSGAEALVLAPCHVVIQGEGQILGHYGRISARVGESGKGFRIDTPVAKVTDLGTEFGVSIVDGGLTEVAVFEGEVDLEVEVSGEQDLAVPETNRLVQGEGLRIDRFGKTSRLVSIDNTRLPTVRQLPPVFERPRVISEVRDNISERDPSIRSFYRIGHSALREDSLAFVDRTHQWNGIDSKGLPKQLIGADYVMPFNDDKFATDLQVSVTLERPATLYVFLSDKIGVPTWLSNEFVDTGLKIGLDEGLNRFRKDVSVASGAGRSIDTVFSVWKRDVHEPKSVSLGAVERPEQASDSLDKMLTGYNMYGIAAVALR